MVRKFFSCIIIFLATSTVFGQEASMESQFGFSIEKKIETLPVENQYMSSTCWSFASLSMIESELIKDKNETVDLSEMFIVRCVYLEKAKKYVRMHGKINFTGGGALNDVTDIIEKYGIVPQEAYPGLEEDQKYHIHYRMDSLLLDYVDNLVEKETLPTDWLDGFIAILDDELGKAPSKFEYKGQEFTPESFAQHLGIKTSDYILLTSYTHHPFYQPFILEVPDNWSWGQPYNVPLDELVMIIDSALMNGHSVAWATDISEDGFSWSNGLAINPVKFNEKCFTKPVKEAKVDQEQRQRGFDNYETTDDHGMQIVGIARDKKGKKYYYVKNSWGKGNMHDGYIYATESYLKSKTMTIQLNKNAIPASILEKL